MQWNYREMVMVHHDKDFLDDVPGKLGEYVQEELNVRGIVACNDPLKYACLSVEHDFSVLGKRLGRAMSLVTKEVKKLGQKEILAFQKSGAITIAGHELTAGDIKVVRDFEAPEGVNQDEVDAAGMASYIKESVGSHVLPKEKLPSHAFGGVAGGTFKITLAKPALSFASDLLLQLCTGNKEHAESISVVLLPRDPAALKSSSPVKDADILFEAENN